MTEHAIDEPLPPVPDVGGDPRPPAASSPGTTDLAYDAEPTRASYGPGHRAPRRYQFGPEDEPALEMVTQPRLARWRIAALVGVLYAALLLMFCVVVALVAGIGVAWWGWIVLIALVVLGAIVRQVSKAPPAGPIVAGAWWAGTDHRHAVRTYQLVEIGQGEIPNTPWLLLVDDHGRTMLFDRALAQTHPPLWALIHNGIRHSVAEGATIPDVTRERLLGPRDQDHPPDES